MKKILFLTLTFVTITLLTGCSFWPTYHSKSYVKKYVNNIFGSEYKLIEQKKYNEDSEEKNLMYEYIFKNDEDISFSVYSYTYHPDLDGSETKFYEKGIRNNYISSVINHHIDEIKKLCDETNLDIKINENNYNFITFYLNSSDEIKEASTLMEKIDKLLSLEYNNTKYPYRMLSYYFEIYLKPDDTIEDWKDNYRYMITKIDLSHDDNERLNSDEIIKNIEKELEK